MISNKFRSLIKVIPAGLISVLMRLNWTRSLITNKLRSPFKIIPAGLMSTGASVGTTVHSVGIRMGLSLVFNVLFCVVPVRLRIYREERKRSIPGESL